MEKRINLFITEQNSYLSVEGNRLNVKVDKQSKLDLPLINIRQIVLFGNIGISPVAINRCLNENIIISFLSMRGKFIGQIVPPYHNDSKIITMQIKRSEDLGFKTNLSRRIVDAKIRNSISIISKRYKKQFSLEEDINSLQNILERLNRTDSIKEILGYEGSSARIYFGMLSKILNKEYGFDGRTKNPPMDPVNSMLSFSYTLLHTICYSMLVISGLNPNIGFFHEQRFGHPTLASDIMKELRAYVCDRLVIRLVNQGYFKKDSFTYTDKGVFFKDDSLKRFLKEWASNLDNEVEIDNAINTNIWRLIEVQTEKIKRSIISGEQYKPFLVMENNLQ